MTQNQATPPAIERLIRRGRDAAYTDEYGCKLRRLFPWPAQADTKRPLTGFGAIWVVIQPGQTVDAHAHNEEEAFLVVEGTAELVLDGVGTVLGRGDVAYIPRFSRHSLSNTAEGPFAMIDLYWDWQGRTAPDGGLEAE